MNIFDRERNVILDTHDCAYANVFVDPESRSGTVSFHLNDLGTPRVQTVVIEDPVRTMRLAGFVVSDVSNSDRRQAINPKHVIQVGSGAVMTRYGPVSCDDGMIRDLRAIFTGIVAERYVGERTPFEATAPYAGA